MLIGKADIRRLIPHAGRMCLLDSVCSWNPETIVCIAGTHRDQCHPLRRDGRLSAIHAVEYGAQAAAIHGALLARATGRMPTVGYLGALRNVCLAIARLDTIPTDLEVSARLLFADHGNAIYACLVEASNKRLAEARITIIERPGTEPCDAT